MRTIQIDGPWGTHLRHWLKEPSTFALLDQLTPEDTSFVSWHSGGCRVLACAIARSLTQSNYPGKICLKTLTSKESPIADHVVLKIITPANKTWYVDGDGARKKETLLKRFAQREGRTEVKIVDYDERILDESEIQCPPYKLMKLAQALSEVISRW